MGSLVKDIYIDHESLFYYDTIKNCVDLKISLNYENHFYLVE